MPRLALLLTTLIWGATFPATKAALDQIPPLSFLLLRFLLGTLLVGVWLAFVSRRLDRGRPVLAASAVATVFLFLGYTLQTVGLRYTGASNSAFLTALYVVFVPLLLRRFDGRVMLAAAVAVAGLWLLVKPSAGVNVGDLLTLGCAVAFAGHIICLERFTRVHDGPSLLLWQMAATTLLFAPTAWWEQAPDGAFAPTTVLLIGLGVTGVLATGAFGVQMWVQKFVPAQQVALVFASEPAYAAWLSWYFLGETLDLEGWIGSALILSAVIIGAFESRPQSPSGQIAQPA
jgi:drug/metabolite transporter (DMT)-like permease